MNRPNRPALGAILAGGASSRFGAPKAWAAVDGRPIVRRVHHALLQVVDPVIVACNDPAAFAALGLEMRPDRILRAGPLAGIETALAAALEMGFDGALCVACDLPFVSPALLRELAARAGEEVDAVVPESGGRRGCEPLCAWYSVDALPRVTAAIDAGEGSVVSALGSLRVERVPLQVVRRCGDPDVIFLNVNTRDDLARAEALAARLDARA